LQTDYRDRKSWEKTKGGSYISKKPHPSRFIVCPTYNRIGGGDCWKLIDLVTKETDYRRSFTDCRQSAFAMANAVCRRSPEDYHIGMTAYTASGDRVRIDYFDRNGYRCKYTYLNGEEKGKQGYIAEVNWLLIRKEPDRTGIDLL